jgi:dihydrofolate reductase
MNPDSPVPLQLVAIAAMAGNRVIGKDGGLPWDLPCDLQFFKQTTMGHPVLMGRNTFESIVSRLGKPLPGRRNIVLSRSMPARPDVDVISDFASLEQLPNLSSPVYLIGGAQLYEQLLPQCDELLLTFINAPYEGDTLFPPFEGGFELKDVLLRTDDYEIRRYRRSNAAVPV